LSIAANSNPSESTERHLPHCVLVLWICWYS